MSRAAADNGPLPGGRALPLATMLAALGVLAGLELAGLIATGGVFEYPLDDPYIHLSLAEQIAAGGYGVNPGELASPGSSPLYPLLLTPFAGTGFHRFLPLIWNLIGLALGAGIWGRILAEAGFGRDGWRGLGLAAALVGPFALMLPQVAMLGMEHSLHSAASLAVVLGLARHLTGRGGLRWVLLGVLAGSALRFEALALGLLAAATLGVTGARRAGLVTALAAVLPLVLFAAVLAALGLDPLPSSVQAKMVDGTVTGLDALTRWSATLQRNLAEPGGPLLLALALANLALWRLAPGLRGNRLGLLGLVAALAGAAQLFFGKVGWLDRYENYAVVTMAAALLALLPRAVGERRPGLKGLTGVVGVLAAGLIAYQPSGTRVLPESVLAIHSMQGQMSRFVKDYLKAPVAVNDVGLISYQNPAYVLDLWGLANAGARARRLTDPAPGWAGNLTDAHHVPAALVFDRWFGDGIGRKWVKLGELRITRMIGFLGAPSVSFYATSPAEVARMRGAIVAWLPGLGGLSAWRWAEGMAP